MANDGFSCKPAAAGTWWYDGTAARRVEIMACNYDRVHDWLMEEIQHTGESADEIGQPRPMGPDGVLYHVHATASPDFDTLAEAKAWADAQPWGPVTWDR